jgi:MFS family permease
MTTLIARFMPALAPARLLDFSPAVQRALRIDVSVMLLFTLFTGLTTPFTGLILRRDLGASAFQLSMLASASAACLLLSLALARLIDSRRPLPWVVWPTFAARGLFVLVPFIDTPWPFVGMLVAGTLLGTMSGPAQTALVEQVYPREERGRALGTVRVAGMLASLRQRRMPVPDTRHDAGSPARPRLREAWGVVREDHAFRRVLLASTVFGTGIWLMMPANPILLADVMQATPAQVGVLAAAAAVAALFGNLLWGRLVDRNSSVGALRVVYALGTFTPLIYFAVSLMARSPWALLGGSITESLMHTGLDLVWMLAMIELGGKERTTQYAAIGATLAGVRGVLGPLLGALVIETLGLRAVYLVAAALMACGAWMVARHPQKTPRYIEQPAHTSGGVALMSAARNTS